MRTLLEAEGFRVECASDGLEALDRVAQGEPPSVILTDLHMPVMDGQHLCQELRRHPTSCNIPVLVISSDIELPEIAAMLEVEGYCCKPVKFDSLLDAVRRTRP
jgi:CheY-like chemotaxis protein